MGSEFAIRITWELGLAAAQARSIMPYTVPETRRKILSVLELSKLKTAVARDAFSIAC